MSPIASYRFFQAIIVLIFTLNIAAACANVRPSSVYLIARRLNHEYNGSYLHFNAISYLAIYVAKRKKPYDRLSAFYTR